MAMDEDYCSCDFLKCDEGEPARPKGLELWFVICFICTIFIIGVLIQTSRAISAGKTAFTGMIERSRSKYEMLTQKHIDPITTRRWKSVYGWIAFHPDELLLRDKTGQNFLHHACLFRAPAEVIEMILFQASEVAAMANHDGELAIHWAIRLSAPNEILKSLLLANPVSGILAKDNQGNTPLSLLWERHQDQLLQTRLDNPERMIALPAWKRIMLLFEAYRRATDEHNSSPSVLHIASSCHCPPAFFPLLVNVYRDEIEKKDTQGRLPLTIACADPSANRSTDVHTKIQMLVAEHPNAAHVPDNDGRRPIYVALASGVAWEEGLEDLFNLDPKCLADHDPMTRLCPFMLAAVGAGNRLRRADGAWTRQDEAKSLATVYSMLRVDPARVTLCGKRIG